MPVPHGLTWSNIQKNTTVKQKPKPVIVVVAPASMAQICTHVMLDFSPEKFWPDTLLDVMSDAHG